MAEFKSNLKNRLNDYISFKRSIGKKYEASGIVVGRPHEK